MIDLPSPAALALAPASEPGAVALAASIERVSAALRELGDTVHALQRGEFGLMFRRDCVEGARRRAHGGGGEGGARGRARAR